MMRGPSMFARVGPAQRPLLPTVALEHGRIQIQTISGRTFWQPLQLPVPQAGEKTLALSLPEPLEQVANGVVHREASGNGRCCFTASQYPTCRRNSKNTTSPPNGVTARGVSRNSTFFPPQREVIFQCTVLSSSAFLSTN